MLVTDMVPKFLLRLLTGVVVLYSASSYAATPCDGLHKHLTTEATRFYESQTEKRLAEMHLGVVVTHVDLVDIFQFGDWVMLYADPHVLEDLILLYHTDRGRASFVTDWSGGPRLDEQPALEDWMHKNAPGVPNALARCFAWYVTLGRTQ